MTSYLYDDGNGLRTSARVEPTTGKPITDVSNMVKTKSGLWIPQTGTEDGAANVQVAGSDVMLPTQLQAKLSTTIQTQASTVVPATTGTNTSAFQDISNYSDIGLTFSNSGNTNCQVDLIWSHDGVNPAISETVLQSAARWGGNARVKRLARYVAVKLYNTDASPKTMGAWLDLSV